MSDKQKIDIIKCIISAKTGTDVKEFPDCSVVEMIPDIKKDILSYSYNDMVDMFVGYTDLLLQIVKVLNHEN